MDSIIEALKSALGLGGGATDPAAQAAAKAELDKKVSRAKTGNIVLGCIAGLAVTGRIVWALKK